MITVGTKVYRVTETEQSGTIVRHVAERVVKDVGKGRYGLDHAFPGPWIVAAAERRARR